MSYKRLGDYIQPVNIRNNDLGVTTLLGVSIRKILMPSIANTIGTNMKTYKIIKQNQFAYGPVTSRNGDKISIALLEEHETAIVSQAYTVFEVKDEQEVLPEYLMMWFRRPEFDRFTRFKSHGSAREVFDWEELCDTQLPIPSIEKQRQIVAEYNTVTNRINLNNQLNQKLEATSQALYKHWFVDFEFPNQDGKPYKSSGGEMVFNEELEKGIPVGFSLLPISNFCDVTFSKRIYQSEYTNSGIPFYRSKEIILKKKGVPLRNEIYIKLDRYVELSEKFGGISKGDILLTAVGTIGISYLITKSDKFYFKDGNLFWFKNFKTEGYNHLIYEWMQTKSFEEKLEEITFGSTQKVITTKAVYLLNHISPNLDTLKKYNFLVGKIYCQMENLRNQSHFLNETKSLLLSKMTQSAIKQKVV
ncbi:MAG: type I restriction enzyme S subunit [Vicingaceae bacterium]|jgi:type I restriction enzyme S subunit